MHVAHIGGVFGGVHQDRNGRLEGRRRRGRRLLQGQRSDRALALTASSLGPPRLGPRVTRPARPALPDCCHRQEQGISIIHYLAKSLHIYPIVLLEKIQANKSSLRQIPQGSRDIAPMLTRAKLETSGHRRSLPRMPVVRRRELQVH